MRIALFLPCFNDALFPRTGIATVRILERLGHEVFFPRDQTCCGQIHFNTGFRKEAGRLFRRFLSIFGDAEVVVAPSASCVAMVREQYRELGRDSEEPALLDEIGALAGRTFELCEFLVGKLGVEELGARFPHRVTFHPTCHSVRSIDVGDAPLRLLRAVEGLELVHLPRAEECCGFGGTFSVKNPHTSLAMMEDKIRRVQESGASVLTAVDNSCLMHLAGGMRRSGLLAEEGGAGGKIRVIHVAEILASTEGEGSDG
ncbi:MAG: (Fe-S)-binding protein [Longimicrobiales bacterium]